MTHAPGVAQARRPRYQAERRDAASPRPGFARLLPTHPLAAEIRRQEARWKGRRAR